MKGQSYLLAAACLGVLSSVLGHMEIKSPAPRKSTFSKYYKSIGDIDYDMNAPLGDFGGFPCKDYKAGPVEYAYNAGDTVQVQFAPGNTHDGGHCQFALSYDNDNTFVVLKTVVRNCFKSGLTFDVPIPATAPPSKRATLAWTWVNAEGNREYYMNCVDITINGGVPGGTITGPKLMVANLPGYPTIPEMNIGQGDGHELLDKRPIITVGSGDGGSLPEPSTTPSATITNKPSTITTATSVKPSSTTTVTSAKPTATENPGTGACVGISAWSANVAYNGSQKVTYNEHLWQAKWWTQNETPGKQGVWTDLGAC